MPQLLASSVVRGLRAIWLGLIDDPGGRLPLVRAPELVPAGAEPLLGEGPVAVRLDERAVESLSEVCAILELVPELVPALGPRVSIGCDVVERRLHAFLQ